jgi:hypothetical protein
MSVECCFCEACGETMPIPKFRGVDLLCPVCRRLPRQNPNTPSGKRATFRELMGKREEPRSRMLGSFWS